MSRCIRSGGRWGIVDLYPSNETAGCVPAPRRRGIALYQGRNEMWELNAKEAELVFGGYTGSELPPPGVSQWEWDQLLYMLEEQRKRYEWLQQN